MSLVEHAKRELDLIGIKGESSEEYDGAIRECVLQIVELFANQGHSGFSANMVCGLVEKLMRYEPLSPLTGEADEWVQVGEEVWQNKRCSHVFKQIEAYDINGKVFWEWAENEEGEKFKLYFTNIESHVPITFPYTPTTEYIERVAA